MSLLHNHNILRFHRRKNSSHCRMECIPLCQGGGLSDLQFKSHIPTLMFIGLSMLLVHAMVHAIVPCLYLLHFVCFNLISTSFNVCFGTCISSCTLCSFCKEVVSDCAGSLSGHHNPVPHCMAGNDWIYQH